MVIDSHQSSKAQEYCNNIFKTRLYGLLLFFTFLPGIVYAEACMYNPREICSTPFTSEWKFVFDNDINNMQASLNLHTAPYGCSITLTIQQPEWTSGSRDSVPVWSTGSFMTGSAVSIPVVFREFSYVIVTGSPAYCELQVPNIAARYLKSSRDREFLCPGNQSPSYAASPYPSTRFCSSTSPCPASTTFNPKTGMCDGSNLTITLSGDTNTTEPWHKKHDPEHLKANLPYKAIVKDQNRQPKANFGVTITTDATSNSGGHVHTNGRPKGKLVEQVGTAVKTKDGKVSISGYTNGSGIFEFTFGAEEASGTHTLTAKCDSGCQAPATATVDVGIKGLMQLDADPLSYELRGSRDKHPSNHYFSPAALVNIINLAHYYRVKFGKPLMLNDSSLIKGGLFDISGQWAPSHKSHRRGIVIDINNYRTDPNQDFEELAKKFGITPVWEGLNVTDTPHYHLWLTGKDN